jgi:co-chaperonin GroES (HSP10)
MIVNPKPNILLIKKHKRYQLKADIVIEDSDEDKRLLTGEVLSAGDSDYQLGTTVIFGKYAIFPLTLQDENYYFIDKDDVIGTCDYVE